MTDNCTAVTRKCPVEGTIYGYSPNLVASVVFCALFSACCIIQLVQMLKWRLWSFGIALILGASSETAGYIGRILLHKNPYDSTGFEIQICTLTMGPAFWSAAIYLTLKHEVDVLGHEFSLLKPKWYPYIFVTCDLISLTLQGAGGGLAATADTPHGSAVGSDVMLAGIIWQVITLTVFVVISLHFFLKIHHAPKHRLSVEAQKVWEGRKFWVFCFGVSLAFITTYARCVYRIAEMAGGWRNPIMQDKLGFIILESVMCAIAVAALCITHPGFCFEQMRSVRTEKAMEDSILLERKLSPQGTSYQGGGGITDYS
ncbi:RTA1 domain-containing protein [Aspergillus lucknowensis]|uniref:RTA1 like protein-domain-containing protein n=1 Tax=Aspergillus lucknowensis TaxID=176173 RepID=A0ABR4L8J2_9EURO